MKINRVDHLVLTVSDIARTLKFYTEILNMEEVDFDGRKALKFGDQKINLQQKDKTIDPKAKVPTPGSADFCLISDTELKDVIKELQAKNITTITGPVERTGASGKILSLYLRDPDDNLIEISNYLP